MKIKCNSLSREPCFTACYFCRCSLSYTSSHISRNLEYPDFCFILFALFIVGFLPWIPSPIVFVHKTSFVPIKIKKERKGRERSKSNLEAREDKDRSTRMGQIILKLLPTLYCNNISLLYCK